MLNPIYDTRDGIQAMATTLKGLNELEDLRNEAGYKRDERLHQWYVLGRYWLDSCGNFGRILPPFIPGDKYPDVPSVLDREEFMAFLATKMPADEIDFSCSFTSNLPPHTLRCAECKRRWTIRNAHHVVVVHQTQVIPLAQYIGQKLGDVKRQMSRSCTDTIYYMQPDIMIRNDKHIDLRPHPKYASLKINEGGWLRDRDGIDDNYVVEPGDEGYWNTWKYYHPSCNRAKLARDQEEEFRQIFVRAGFKWPKLTAVKNQYCGCEYCAPWYEVKTKYGKFTIGWRKRVINLDWSATGRDFLPLFADEDVTKESGYIHAWGVDQCVDFLTRIKSAI